MSPRATAPRPRRTDTAAQRLLKVPVVRAVRKAAYLGLHLMPVSERVQAAWQWRTTRAAASFELTEARRQAPLDVAVRVGVVIATYQRPALCARAVASALAQTCDDLHVVVVVDGGPSPELPPDPRLSVVVLRAHTGNLGLVRNVGLRLLEGSVACVAFLDDDNEWLPDHLDVHLRERRGAGCLLTYSAMEVVTPEGRQVRRLGTAWSSRDMRRRNHVDANCIVVDAGPDLHFSRLHRANLSMRKEDWELVRRAARRREVRFLDEVTVRYLQNPASHLTDPPPARSRRSVSR